MLQVIPEIVEIQGRHKVKLTLRDGQTILDAELVDPLNANARRKAAARFAERCGEPHAAERIEQAILQCIDEINSIKPDQTGAKGGAGNGAGNGAGAGAGEVTIAVTAANLVRAELFLTEQVVGMTVPETVIRNNEATGRWRTYFRWKDATRESRELPARVDLKDGEASLWIHPLLNAPQVPTISNWSDASRQKWIDGDADPDPVEVFDALCAAFDDYLDLESNDERPTLNDEQNAGSIDAPSSPVHHSAFPHHPHPCPLDHADLRLRRLGRGAVPVRRRPRRQRQDAGVRAALAPRVPPAGQLELVRPRAVPHVARSRRHAAAR